MSTSLAEELKKLTVPQTSLLVHTKKKASLLFDPKEAAGFDRETFYEIGVTGFEELKKLNSNFEKFGSTLFSSASQGLERSMESHDTNKKLNTTIRRFLISLSPYFLLRPSHQALEWLINRFLIHEHNKEDLLLLILPYHETKMFVKVLQLLNLKDEASPWHWLKAIQKPGVPLSKTAVLNRCASDVSFLKFVCDGVISAVKEFGSEAHCLVTMFAFFCSMLVGTFENCSKVTEVQLTSIMTVLLKGLSSPVGDFAMASFMITAQLVSKVHLGQEVLDRVIYKVAKNPCSSFRTEKVALLVILYQTQTDTLKFFPDNALLQLSNYAWFPAALGQLVTAGGHVTQLLESLMAAALKIIQANSESAESIKVFVKKLVTNVFLDESDAQLIIRTVVKSIDGRKVLKEAAAKDIQAVNDNKVLQWYSKILKHLERQYPGPYDKAMKAMLKNKKILKKLQVILDCSDTGNMLEKLNHPISEVRVQAVEYVVKNFSKMKVNVKQELKHTISERLKDDDNVVVGKLLGLGMSELLSIVDSDFLLECLISLAVRCWQTTDQPPATTRKVLNLLCSFRVTEPGLIEAQILLALFPYLLPITAEDMPFVNTILKSEFATSSKMLMHVRGGIAAIDHDPEPEDVCTVVWENLKAPVLPDVAILSKAVEKVPQNGKDVSRHLLSIIIMANAAPKNDARTCLGILNNSISIVEESRMYVEELHMHLNGKTIPLVLLAAKEGTFAVQAFIYCLIVLMKCMSVPPHLKETRWWTLSGKTDDAAAFLVRMFEVLLTGCNLDNDDMKKLYVEGVKEYFKLYFPMEQLQVQFLSKLSVGGEVGDDTQIVNPELQVNSLRLVTELLKNCGRSCQWLLKWSNTLVQSVVVALASPLTPVRKVAMDCLTLIGKSCNADAATKSNWSHLVRTLLSFKEEIEMDSEQLSLAMHVFLDEKATDTAYQTKTLHTILSTIVDDKTPAFVSSVLLSTLKIIHSKDIFVTLVPLGEKVLSQQSQSELNIHGSAILRNIVSKLDPDTSCVLEDPRCWQFVEMMLMDGNTVIWDEDGKHSCPAVLMLQQITGELFANLKSELQHKIFDLIVTISTSTDQTAVLSAINHIMKVIIIDASLLLPHLVEMKNASLTEMQITGVKKMSKKPRRIVNPAPSSHLLQTDSWKKGVTVLEFIQNKKKLHSVQLIVPVLFDILKKALEFEEQAPVEYTKQLLLSCMLHCLEKLPQPDTELLQPEKLFNVELIIQCIRSTQNPQTQHHALLLLSYLAEILPEQVLHNMMSIFTFIGYSVLRLDDTYSFQIITKILDSVVPILIKKGDNRATSSLEQSCTVVGVLRVFADALLDVPVHRRLPVFQKLLCTMDTSQSLWIFLCLVLESHVLKGEPDKSQPSNMLVSKRVEFCLELTLAFPPSIILESCIRIMDYLRSLPASKDVKILHPSGVALFDVEQHSPKQLRHFRYALSLFLCTVLSSTALINKIASLGDEEIHEMEPLYTSGIEAVLKLIRCMTREADRNVTAPNVKYGKIMLNQSYEMLSKLNSLLPSEMFLRVVRSLLDNRVAMVRRKAMELLNKRLQHQVVIYSSQSQQLASLLPPLAAVVDTIGQQEGQDAELELNQQMSLLSLKLLARILAPTSPQQFLPLLNRVTDLVASSLPQGNVLGSVVLFLAELTAVLKAHAIVSLPIFMPALIKLLRKQRAVESPNVVVVSVATAMHKIVETLASFMSPYLDKLLMEICLLSGKWQDEKDAHLTSTVQKLKSTRQKISTCIPSRVLVPAVARCYTQLLKKQEYSAVGALMGILSESFSAMSPAELAQHQPELGTFFQQALQFRSDSSDDISLDDVSLVEGHCVDALVALILKLSESYFRPLYYGLYHWATSTESHKDRTITFYRVSNSIAEKLKGLCVLFAGHYLKNAADLLDANNTVKTDSLHFGSGELAIKKTELLLEYILKTLHQVFMYDSQKFVNKERFDTLMQPIIDQLENTLNGLEALTARGTSLVVPCITQLAVAVADDASWKDLIYQVLLKTRHNTPEVRLVALKALCEVVRVLGDAFMPFLPETVPFLAELLEDEHEAVEKEAKKAVQEIEELIGEPLQKYF